MPIRTRSIALVAALVALLVPDALARVKVTINFDKAFDFKSVNTWDWGPDGPGSIMMARTQEDDPEAMKKFAEPPIVDAVAVEMTRRGLSRAPSDPHVIVTYYLLLTTSMSAQTVGQFMDPTMAWGLPLFPQATQSLKILNRGSLVLDLSASGKVVWRGVAQAEIRLDTPVKKREELLREGVRDLLRRFPPKQ